MKHQPIDPDPHGEGLVAPPTPPPLIRIRMECHDLRCVPRHPLPPPFRLRRYRPGDIETWVRIETAADRFRAITPALFEQQFGTDPTLLEPRQLFLCDETGEAIGTATAWWDVSDPQQNWGRIHWFAIVPAWQRRGLGRPLLSAVCQRLRELGHPRAYLMTETVRAAAIALYETSGFSRIDRPPDG
jgi:GNAT superfamily N-acetyltransferase